MQLQEIFDKVVNHLRTQGKPAFVMKGKEPVCMYRTDTGLKCAAGCLIDDEDYSTMFENKRFAAIMGDTKLGHKPQDVTTLISRLQQAHDYSTGDMFAGVRFYSGTPTIDNAARLKLVEERLRIIATDFRLAYTPVTS